jgi:NADH-quinone oxidoreductase subunit C
MEPFDRFPGSGDFWDDGVAADALRADLQGSVLEVEEFRGERTLLVPAERIGEVLAFLRDDERCRFDMLTDVTAVHWPQREKQFDVVWLLYSHPRNLRLRVKAHVGLEEPVPSAVPLWATADWLERECFDMFGVRFEGHPDLRRILMPEDYEGWPLRKEFPLKR